MGFRRTAAQNGAYTPTRGPSMRSFLLGLCWRVRPWFDGSFCRVRHAWELLAAFRFMAGTMKGIVSMTQDQDLLLAAIVKAYEMQLFVMLLPDP